MKPQQITLFSASAGSGKTYTLTIEYIKMALCEIENKGYFRRILAVTFTIKAAEEMRQRILQFLTQIADFPHFHQTEAKDQAKTLAILEKIQTELAADGYAFSKEELASRAATTLRQILQDYGLFSVMTIDSFVQRLSASFIEELNLPSQYEVLLDSNALIHELINQLLDQVNLTGDPALTDLMVSFANQEVTEGRNWNRIRDSLHTFLKITLDEKFLAVEGNMSRFSLADFRKLEQVLVESLSGMLEELVKIAESFNLLVQSSGEEEGSFFRGSQGPAGIFRSFATQPEIAGKPYRYLVSAIAENNWTSAKATKEAKVRIESISSELAALGTQFLELQEVYDKRYRFLQWIKKDLKKMALLSSIQEEMRLFQAENSAIPISEFSKRVYEVISKDPIPFIYEKLGDRYFHILIDEFQDTSILQWKNFMPLLENATSIGKKSLLVGDAKQSIYKFRGGEVSLIASLSAKNADLVKSHFEVDSLDEQRFSYLIEQIHPQALKDNYRSAEQIVSFNNEFYESISQQEEVANLCRLISPLYGQNLLQNPKVAGSELNGQVDLLVYHKSKENFGFSEPEAEFMFQQVVRLIHHNLTLGFKLQDIAILTRKNRHSRYLALRLKEQQIPVISSDSLLLHYSPIVGFILSFLALKDNPTETLYLYEVVYQYAEIQNQEVSASELSLIKDLKAKDAFEKAGVYFQSKGLQLPVFGDFLQWVYELVRVFDLLNHPTGQDYLWKFLDVVNDYVLKMDKEVAGFLAYFNQNKNSFCIQSSDFADAVTISSIHKSKGLEYPVVIVPFSNWTFQADSERIWYDLAQVDLDELQVADDLKLQYYYGRVNASEATLFPALSDQMAQEKDAIFLDALNMLYVATTRPKQVLHLIISVPTEDMHPKTVGNFKHSVARLLFDFAKSKSTSIELPAFLIGETPWQTSYYSFSDQDVIPYREKENTELVTKQYSISLQSEAPIPALRVNSSKSDLYTLAANKREIGNALHSILEKLTDVDSWPGVRAKAQFDVHLIDALLENEKIRPFFEKDKLYFKEVDILCPDGKVIRPDRVVQTPEGLQVIDFKTGKKEDKHKVQLTTYKQILMEMGHKVVPGVLIYLETNELTYV